MDAKPTTTTSAFHIEECTPADIDALVHVYLSAFSAEPLHESLFPLSVCPWENQAPWLHTRFARRLETPEPGVRHFKLVETASGRMASFGRFGFPHPKPAAAAEKTDEPADEDADWPEGARVDACRKMFNGLDEMQRKWVDVESMYVVGLLGTDPEFQRRGCASALLKHVLDMADAEGRKAYIEATAAGFPVYKKLGWKVIDKLEFDIDEKDLVKGGETTWYNWVMMREPVLEN